MCRVLGIHRSGFYAWLKNPLSRRAREDERLVEQIRHFWNESDGTYGSPRIFLDLREVGESCGKNRVAKLMRENRISAVLKLKRRNGSYAKPEKAQSNILDRQFNHDELDTAWVTGDSGEAGFSQHLHPHVGGLALSGGGDGPRIEEDHRLVDAANDPQRPRAAGTALRSMAQTTGARGDRAFGSRVPVRQRRLDPLLRTARPRAQHESPRQRRAQRS